jgi:hypothetical protein
MAATVVTSLRREMSRIKKDISRRTSELAYLRDELRRYERVLRLLGTGKGHNSALVSKRSPATDWNSVLKNLPSPFAFGDLTKRREVKTRSRVYLHQILSRWIKQRKIRRVARGKYQKI